MTDTIATTAPADTAEPVDNQQEPMTPDTQDLAEPEPVANSTKDGHPSAATDDDQVDDDEHADDVQPDDVPDESEPKASDAPPKVSIMIELQGATAFVGVQRSDTDPYFMSFPAEDVNAAIAQTSCVVEAAEAKWQEQPHYAQYHPPEPVAADHAYQPPKQTAGKKRSTPKPDRETKPAGTERAKPAETEKAETLALF